MRRSRLAAAGLALLIAGCGASPTPQSGPPHASGLAPAHPAGTAPRHLRDHAHRGQRAGDH